MPTVTLSHNVAQVRKSLKNYQIKQLPAATTRALNRTLRGTVTDTKRLIAKRINLTQSEVAKQIRSKPATKKTGNTYQAVMTVKGGFKRNLASFKSLRKTKKGLSGKIWKTQTKYPGAFIWTRTISAGGTAKTAFHRVKGADKVVTSKGTYRGKRIQRGPRKGSIIKRQPIKPIYGDSVIGIFTFKGRRPPVQQILRRTIPRRFNVELRRQIARIRR